MRISKQAVRFLYRGVELTHKLVILRSNIDFHGRDLGCQIFYHLNTVREVIELLVKGIKLVVKGLQLPIKESLKIIHRIVKNNAWHGCSLYTPPVATTD
jgi:hypothetical protein